MLRYPVPNLDFFDQISFLLVIVSLFSSVVEHWSRKPGVVSSILTGGSRKSFFITNHFPQHYIRKKI